jgi:predicted flap endonuclease-1-like 5' DNA nuclease
MAGVGGDRLARGHACATAWSAGSASRAASATAHQDAGQVRQPRGQGSGPQAQRSLPAGPGPGVRPGRLPASDVDALFAATGVRDVWGIGPRLSAQLQADGITTVLQLVRMDPPWRAGAGASSSSAPCASCRAALHRLRGHAAAAQGGVVHARLRRPGERAADAGGSGERVRHPGGVQAARGRQPRGPGADLRPHQPVPQMGAAVLALGHGAAAAPDADTAPIVRAAVQGCMRCTPRASSSTRPA